MDERKAPRGWIRCPRVAHPDNPDGWVFAELHDRSMGLLHRWVRGRYACITREAVQGLGLTEED